MQNVPFENITNFLLKDKLIQMCLCKIELHWILAKQIMNLETKDEVGNLPADEELHDYLDDDETLYSRNNYFTCVLTEDGSFQHESNAVNSLLNNKTKSYSERLLRVMNTFAQCEKKTSNFESKSQEVSVLESLYDSMKEKEPN